MSRPPLTLYGAPHSLYTGRARSYLIKAAIAYRETAPNTLHYRDTVVPAAGGRRGIPTIEFADGSVIRDGAAIIDHFEEQSARPFSPSTPIQRLFSRLFDVIGAEGLLRPAMHYRWNFPQQNSDFLAFHFSALMPRDRDQAAMGEAAAERMRAAARSFGAVPQTFHVIEAHYADVMAALDAHFADHPYLLGGRPCIGDFGMIAPLYGHLGRDPAPLALMQKQAVHLFRWVERMQRPEADLVEYGDQQPDYLPADQIPQTLLDVLQVLAEDFVPETLAAARCINEWLAGQTGLAAGSEAARGVGMCRFELRGAEINALAQPYRFYLLQRVQAEYAALDAATRQQVDQLLAACGLQPLIVATLSRPIGRRDNLEVWL